MRDARVLDVVDRCGPGRAAYPLAAEILAARDRRASLDQDLLPGEVVDGREVDLMPPLAGDGHGADHDVDLIACDERDPLDRGDGFEVDRVLVTKDGLGDL